MMTLNNGFGGFTSYYVHITDFSEYSKFLFSGIGADVEAISRAFTFVASSDRISVFEGDRLYNSALDNKLSKWNPVDHENFSCLLPYKQVIGPKMVAYFLRRGLVIHLWSNLYPSMLVNVAYLRSVEHSRDPITARELAYIYGCFEVKKPEMLIRLFTLVRYSRQTKHMVMRWWLLLISFYAGNYFKLIARLEEYLFATIDTEDLNNTVLLLRTEECNALTHINRHSKGPHLARHQRTQIKVEDAVFGEERTDRIVWTVRLFFYATKVPAVTRSKFWTNWFYWMDPFATRPSQ